MARTIRKAAQKTTKKHELVVLVYYDTHGRHVATGSLSRAFKMGEAGYVDMNDVVNCVRGLRDNGGPGALPGLGSDTGGGWDGYIHIGTPMRQYHLLLPEGMN